MSDVTDGDDDTFDAILREVARAPDREPPRKKLGPGAKIDRYVIDSLLGEGGMGTVYRARDEKLRRRVALKILHASNADASRRLLREARAAAALDHPNAVSVFDVGDHDGEPFIAMELVKGRSLRAFVGDETIALSERVRWLVDVARALGAAHREGLVHRDVKPDNVMLRDDGAIKVLDFGIARRAARSEVDPSAPTESQGDTAPTHNTIAGTPRYMAPEQVRGEPVDARADQFSWGVMAYELLTGKPPWDARDPMSLAAAIVGEPAPPLPVEVVPTEVDAVVVRALEKKPGDRFASMEEIVAALEVLAAPRAQAIPARAGSSGATQAGSQSSGGVDTPAGAPRGGRRWPAVVLVGAAVAFASGVGWFLRPASSVVALPPPPAASAEHVGTPRLESSIPAAASAFDAGHQAWRDAFSDGALDHFDRAVELDDGLAAAHLRVAIGWIGVPEKASPAFARASAHRARLSPRDLALLDAMGPCLERLPYDVPECLRRLTAAAERFPTDAEILEFQAEIEGRYEVPEQELVTTERAIAIDPSFARARCSKAHALAYLGRTDDALRVVDETLAETAVAVDCQRLRVIILRDRGDCEAVEEATRRGLGMRPWESSLLFNLASAQFTRGEPIATVRHTIERYNAGFTGHFAMYQTREVAWSQALLAAAVGDLGRSSESIAVFAKAVVDDPNQAEHDRPVLYEVSTKLEMGRDLEVGRAAAAYMQERGGWTLSPFPSGGDSGSDQLPFFLEAKWHAGLISRDEFEKGIADNFHEWEARLTPLGKRYLWLNTFALVGAYRPDEHDMAKRAVDRLAALGGLPPFMAGWNVDPEVGETFFAAGEIDRSVAFLSHAVKRCNGLNGPIGFVRRFFLLGRALEAKGDKEGACSAYAKVLERWPHPKPRSVTVDETRARSKALGCGR